jgi:ribosomal protein L7/L12
MKMKADEFQLLQSHIDQILGRSFHPTNEWYYHGFGGSGKKGNLRGAEDGVSEEQSTAAVPEKTAFDMKLVAFEAASKIKIIKEVRAVTGLGLKEAKELVESAPKILQKGLKKEAAEELKKKLEELGATIEIS